MEYITIVLAVLVGYAFGKQAYLNETEVMGDVMKPVIKVFKLKREIKIIDKRQPVEPMQKILNDLETENGEAKKANT